MISSKIRFPVIFVGIFVAAILAALYFATFGRMAKADPAESIQLYCDAFVRQDEEAQKKLTSYGAPTNLSPEEAAEIGDAYMESLKNASIETSVSNQGEGQATVEVTVTRFNMMAAREKATSLMRSRMKLNGTPEELRKTAVDATADAYRELQPMGMATFYVPVRYNEKTRIWDPADPVQFGFDLSKQTMGVE